MAMPMDHSIPELPYMCDDSMGHRRSDSLDREVLLAVNKGMAFLYD
jgi:hypothetical protein